MRCDAKHIDRCRKRTGKVVLTYACKRSCNRCEHRWFIAGGFVTQRVMLSVDEWVAMWAMIHKHLHTETNHISATFGVVSARLWSKPDPVSMSMMQVMPSAMKTFVEADAYYISMGWVVDKVESLSGCYCGGRVETGVDFDWIDITPEEAERLRTVRPTLDGHLAPSDDGDDGDESPLLAIEDLPDEDQDHDLFGPALSIVHQVEMTEGESVQHDMSRVNTGSGVDPDGAVMPLAAAEAIERTDTPVRMQEVVARIDGVQAAQRLRHLAGHVVPWLDVLPADSMGTTQGLRNGAVRTGPAGVPVQVWQDDYDTFVQGIEKRYVAPRIGIMVKFEQDDLRKIGYVLDFIKKNVITPENVADWASNKSTARARAAKTWSNAKLELAFTDACKRGMPYMSSGAVKKEVLVLVEGKEERPRPILADGEAGMVCAVDTVACLEYCIFKHFGPSSIKHLDKPMAMKRVARRIRHKSRNMVILEGDGSAWDGCCTDEVRRYLENVLLKYALDLLMKAHGEIADQALAREHLYKCCDAVNAVRYTRVGKGCKDQKGVMINAIRRTGHRGTSVLNWLTNMVLTCAAMADTPKKAAANARECVSKDPSWFRACFEGDDSIFGVPADDWTGPRKQAYLDLWERAGFKMKIKEHTGATAAEFTGWHFATNNRGLTDEMSPDVRRTVNHASWLSSTGVLQAFRAGSKTKVHALAAATYWCYAAYFAGLDSTVSHYFAGLARYHEERRGSEIVDLDEDQTRWMGSMVKVRAKVETQVEVLPLRLRQQTRTDVHDDDMCEILIAACQCYEGKVPGCWRARP